MSNNKTFSVMAKDVEEALQDLRDAEKAVVDAEKDLLAARAYRDRCRENVHHLRDELFKAHPELAPETALGQVRPVKDTPQAEAEPVPVSSPQGPVVFREREDFDSPFGGEG